MRFLLLIFLLFSCSTFENKNQILPRNYPALSSTMQLGPKNYERDIAWNLKNKFKRKENKKSHTTKKSATVSASKRYWKMTFFDDFKGKTNTSSEEDYCYDQLEPQCHIWPGSSSYNCARTEANFNNRNYFGEHFQNNITASLKNLFPNENFSNYSLDEILEKYKSTINLNQKHLNKCIWTNYEMLNWMATDYNGKYSARFDPLMVKVNPEGRGYLELRASKVAEAKNCAYGGNLQGSDCVFKDFSEFNMQASHGYWLDKSLEKAGVYYKSDNGSCTHGGELQDDDNCQIWKAPTGMLEEKEITFTLKFSPIAGIYYPNKKYRCNHNVSYYNNGVQFKNLNCPIVNGGVTSAHFTALDNNNDQRGFLQKNGRFEVKFRIPKGKGAFPAAWLMPKKGGWPYSGGEIDIIEARDDANEIYQTYHHGKCFEKSTGQEIVYNPNNSAEFIESGVCSSSSDLKSINMHKGYTVKERDPNEFYQRDHVFSVEWVGNEIQHYTNSEKTNSIKVGSASSDKDPAQPGVEWADLPAGANIFSAHNFPHDPFYFILNHSTWVSENHLANNEWPDQKVLVDYIKTYQLCETSEDFCPQGGEFVEGRGCKTSNGSYKPSVCREADLSCPNGGTYSNGQCQSYKLTKATNPNVNYWVDSNPAWPGIYYKQQNNICPYGGVKSGGSNCQLVTIANEILEPGVKYEYDHSTKAVIYFPTFSNESSIESPAEKCPGARKELGSFHDKAVCKALPHFEITEKNCKKKGDHIWNEYCLWNKGDWYKARRLKNHQTSIECTGGRKKLGDLNNKAVCKALPHLKIKKKKCDGATWGNYCIWDKGTWWRARELKN